MSQTGPASSCNQLAGELKELLGFGDSELLLSEAGSYGQGQFGNPEKADCPLLKASNSQ
jgi:hypothetical protein